MFSSLLFLTITTAYCLTSSVQCYNTQEKLTGLYPTGEPLKFLSLSKRSPHFKEWYQDVKARSKQIAHKVLPDPVFKLFGRDKSDSSSDEEGSYDNFRRTEHGSLDSFGRDLVREVGKGIGKVGKKVKFLTSKFCGGLDSNKTFFSGVAGNFKLKVQAIYPGTKWCGDGTKSRSYDDLGVHADADSCCREHDLCSDSMEAGETKYGLTNTGLFTRSHCDCDQRFYNCLKESNNRVSNKIGITYFTILGPQCFREDYPIVDCKVMRSKKCVEYEYDQSEEKCYQWFDSPAF